MREIKTFRGVEGQILLPQETIAAAAQSNGKGGSIRGVKGEIRWAYFKAADVNGFTVSRSPDNAWTLQATVAASNAYNLAQRPLRFVAPTEQGEWIWPIATFELQGGRLAANLGPPIGG